MKKSKKSHTSFIFFMTAGLSLLLLSFSFKKLLSRAYLAGLSQDYGNTDEKIVCER